MDFAAGAILVGFGATLATDLWSVVRQRWLGIPGPDWGLVGRWFGHMVRGQFRHGRIATAAPVHGERVIGWGAHYGIGVAYGALLLALAGPGWMREPTLVPAMAVGMATVAAPFLLMQPGMGLGIAASRTPRPWLARMHSLVTHAVFGFGLYFSGLAASVATRG